MKNIRYEAFRTLWQNLGSSAKRMAALKILNPGTGTLNANFMSDIKVPTCGRIVHFFPNAEHKPRVLPAIVITEYDTYPSLHVFTESEDVPSFLLKTVPPAKHKQEGRPYWDWPEIK